MRKHELQSLLLRIIAEESAVARAKTRQQPQGEMAKATADGVTFGTLPEADLALLKKQAEPVISCSTPKVKRLPDGLFSSPSTNLHNAAETGFLWCCFVMGFYT